MPASVFYFAWIPAAATFSASSHATRAAKVFDGVDGDQEIFYAELTHEEGQFPLLEVHMRDPRVGLLASGRNQWIWFSRDSGSGPEALFTGRVLAVAERKKGDIGVVIVKFRACPDDYLTRRAAVADSLRELPYYDPIWIAEDADTDDVVLETRAAYWHIDRLTLTVSASSLIEGEDGTVEITESDAFFDETEVTIEQAPLQSVDLSLTVQWQQTASGDVDITRNFWQAFVNAGSPYPYPVISTNTGPGLFGDWPEAGTNIGGGWSVGSTSYIAEATWLKSGTHVVHYVDRTDDTITYRWGHAGHDITGQFGFTLLAVDNYQEWTYATELTPYKVNVIVHFDADRKRTEIVTTTLAADVQTVIADSLDDSTTETIEATSDFVSQEVGPDSTSPPTFNSPIVDPARNSFFKTARGAQALENQLLRCRARLAARARCVKIKTRVSFDLAATCSCRKDARFLDGRLPLGEASGKIVSYRLIADGASGIVGEIEAAISVGNGTLLPAAASGTGVYVEDGVLEDGIQARTGAQNAVIVGELQYQSFDDFTVEDDDGVDLLNMRPRTVLNDIVISGGPAQQVAAIDATIDGRYLDPDPATALRDAYTECVIDLVPVTGGPFVSTFAIDTDTLALRKGIDLSAEIPAGSP